MPSLQEMLDKLIAGGRAQQELKKKQNRIKSPNGFKTAVHKTKEDGTTTIEVVDRRLIDSRWKTSNRVLLVREVTCNGCGTIHKAPNEHLMVRRTHPKYGVLEESISPHESQFKHLPIIIETHKSEISVCQDCIRLDNITIPTFAAASTSIVIEPINLPGSIPVLEEELEEGDLGWEDPEAINTTEQELYHGQI